MHATKSKASFFIAPCFMKEIVYIPTAAAIVIQLGLAPSETWLQQLTTAAPPSADHNADTVALGVACCDHLS